MTMKGNIKSYALISAQNINSKSNRLTGYHLDGLLFRHIFDRLRLMSLNKPSNFAAMLLLIVINIIILFHGINNELVWDDREHIEKNYDYREVKNIKKLLTKEDVVEI
ncbi:hypothetical protein ACFL2A_04620, partial [Thermodesulfobacteriota bacterium]